MRLRNQQAFDSLFLNGQGFSLPIRLPRGPFVIALSTLCHRQSKPTNSLHSSKASFQSFAKTPLSNHCLK